MRIYSNYTPAEETAVTGLAKELGFSLSAFQHYCVMLYVGERNNSLPMNTLIAQMQQSLHDQPVGEPFIVSALLPQQWPSLTRAEKLSLAKQLAYLVDQNPGTYKRIGKKYKTWIYEKC